MSRAGGRILSTGGRCFPKTQKETKPLCPRVCQKRCSEKRRDRLYIYEYRANINLATFVTLYRKAFSEYGTRALWNKRLLETPTPEDALVIARALRIEGDRDARLLAEQIEQACRAVN